MRQDERVTGVPGYAYGQDANYSPQKRAWEQVYHIAGAVTAREFGRGETIVDLDPAKVEALSPIQRAVLANGGPLPFGATVIGTRVLIGIGD